jgi:excisionase family DNA binding protein
VLASRTGSHLKEFSDMQKQATAEPAKLPRLLREGEAAAYLGLSKRTLQKDRTVRSMGIPFAKFGHHVRYRESDLDRYIESRMVGLAEAA